MPLFHPPWNFICCWALCWWFFFSHISLIFQSEMVCPLKISLFIWENQFWVAPFCQPKPRFSHHQKSTEVSGLGRGFLGILCLINSHPFPRILPLSLKISGKKICRGQTISCLLKIYILLLLLQG